MVLIFPDNSDPKPANLNRSKQKQTINPATNTGIVTGAIYKKNSIKSQPAIFAINKF